MKDDTPILICVYADMPHLARAIPAFCAKCNRLIVYDPEHMKVIERRMPKYRGRVQLQCMGCAGHKLAGVSAGQMRTNRELIREVPGVGVLIDFFTDEEIRDAIVKKTGN